MELYIIRHGQSVNNATGEDPLRRVHDPELTPIGIRQAQAVADYLASGPNLEKIVTLPLDAPERAHPPAFEFTHLYTSAMHRALQTAYPIASALQVKPEIWLDIHEHGGMYLETEDSVQGFGGRTRTQILSEFPEYLVPELITEEGWWKPENGKEDLSLAQARAIRVAQELRTRAMEPLTKNNRVALVTHGTFIDALLKAFLNTLPSMNYFHWHYNCAMTRLDILDDGRVIIRYINRVTHLTPDLIT